jgi:putative ABC transport system permease protein
MLRLAFRNLFRHVSRTALTLAAIVFGAVSLVLSGGFVEDIFVQLQEGTVNSGLGHAQIYRAGYYELGHRDPYGYMIERAEPIAERVRSLPHVVEVMSRLNFAGTLSNGRADIPILGEGVEPLREPAVGGFVHVVDGRRLTGEDHYAIEIGQGVARALNVGPGDFVTVLTAIPGGALNSLELEVVGVLRSHSIELDARLARVPLDATKELLDIDAVHSLVVALSDAEHTDATVAAIRQMLSPSGLETIPWYELADFYLKTVDLYQRQFAVLQVVILIMVALGVANSVNINIFERTGELGTLRALGNRSRDMSRMLVLENALLGLGGGLIAIPLGLLLAAIISAIGIPMPPPPNMDVGYAATLRPTREHLIMAFLVAVGASTLAAVLPARRVARIPIVEALRHNQP